MPINLTITLSEYFSHIRQRGQRFSIVSKERMDFITAQQDWEKECYFEEIGENPNIVRMWILEDWLQYKSTNMELVAEQRNESLVNAASYHRELEAWKQQVRVHLRKVGKLNEEQINKVINTAISPQIKQLTTDQKEDLTEEQIRQKENIDWEIRNKVISKFPFEFKS